MKTPLGPRVAYRIDAPDDRLIANGRLETTCRVALESPLAARTSVLAGSRPARPNAAGVIRRARLLSCASSLWSHGASGGCVQVEVRDELGFGAAAAFVGSDQRLAILPAAIVLQQLLERPDRFQGVIRPTDWMPTAELIAELRRRGIRALWREIAGGVSASC